MLEVLAANGADVMLAENDEYTPTPAVSHTILAYNRGRDTGLADGIVVTPAQKDMLSKLSPQQVRATDLAGEKIQCILSHAPGNGAPIGGLKVIAENGWFAARPSGTEDIYKIYAESFRGADHLHRIAAEAQAIVDRALADR